ncbi:MAG: hypothetical protein IIW58_05045 [Bacteroidales bacterium]|nr:hypothetical protein [Bacteroidales bacterium]
MKLTAAQKNELIKKLNSYGNKTQPCPICGGKRWNVNDTIVEIREFNNGDMVFGGSDSAIIPMITINCEECGYIRFLSAIKLGIINSK